MWELDYKESRALKNWCFWTVVLEKTLESPLDCKEIKPVNPKGNQSWIFTRRTDAEAEVPILWPPNAKNQRIGKACDAGEDWRQEEKGTTEYEVVGWHHGITNVGNGQGVLACCSPWGRKGSDTTERLNWTELTETSELCDYFEKFSVTTGGMCADIMNTKQSIPYKETLIYLIIWIILIVWMRKKNSSIVSCSVQSIGHVWLFATPDCSMPGLPVHHQLPKLAQTQVRRVSNAIQTSPTSIIPPTLITYYICCLFIMF